jgi:hypothetical protein
VLPLTALPPIAGGVRVDDATLSLRVGQRLNGLVLEIANEHVTLLADGAKLAAQVPDPKTVQALTPGTLAHFIVKGVKDGQIQLEIAPGPKADDAPAAGLVRAGNGPPPAQALLQQTGLADSPQNRVVAEALLRQRLPVTAALVHELGELLVALPGWTAEEAQLAAQLKATGRPLTPGALELAKQTLTPVPDTVSDLTRSLDALGAQDLPAPVRQAVAEARETLSKITLQWQQTTEALKQELRDSLSVIGHTLERELAQGKTPQTEASQLQMAALSRELSRLPQPQAQTAARHLDGLIDGLRQAHLHNLPPEATAQGWAQDAHQYQVSLPIHWPGARGPMAGRIRFSGQGPGAAGGAISAVHTRLVVALPVSETETLEVDLSIMGKQIGAWISASGPEWREAAEAELLSLRDGLFRAGYGLKSARALVRSTVSPGDDAARVADLSERLAGLNLKV